MSQPSGTPCPGGSKSRRRFLKAVAGASAVAAAWPAPVRARNPAAESRKMRLAVVGGGFSAAFWWHQHPGCEVTAVTDLRADRRQRLVERYGCANAFESLEVLLEKASETFDP